MQTFVISSESEWNSWRASWNALTRANPMMSLEWLSAWWRQFGTGQQLYIVAVESEGQLLGVLPCYLQQTLIGKQMRLLGSGAVCSDYIGAMVDIQRASEIYDSIHAYLRQAAESGALKGIKAFHFEGVASDDAWVQRLSTFAEAAGYSLRTQSLANGWAIALPNTWAELQQSQRGSGVHRKAKKCIARLQSQELSIRRISEPADLEEGLSHLVRLHQARRESVGDAGCFADPKFQLFLADALAGMLSEKTASFTLCEREGQVIGVQVLLLGSDTVFMYQSGVDPNYMSFEPGHMLVTGSLLYCIEHGYKVYDFLRGDEPYKAFWGARPKSLQRIVLAPPTFKAQAIEVVQRNLNWLRTCCSSFSTAPSTSQSAS